MLGSPPGGGGMVGWQADSISLVGNAIWRSVSVRGPGADLHKVSTRLDATQSGATFAANNNTHTGAASAPCRMPLAASSMPIGPDRATLNALQRPSFLMGDCDCKHSDADADADENLVACSCN